MAYEALTAQLHFCGSAIHELSAVRTEVDNVREELVSLAKSGTETSEKEAGAKVDVTLATLNAALARCSETVVDAYQAASYHRRWALTCGAPSADRNALLRFPVVHASNGLGVNDTKEVVKPRVSAMSQLAPWHGAEIVIDSDDDVTPSTPAAKTVQPLPCSQSPENICKSRGVNQGSPESIFGNISLSSMSPLSETKLIQNLSEFLSFE